MKVGDTVRRIISCSLTSGTTGAVTPEEQVRRIGEVVYVHPKGRFYVAEFDFPDGKIRESYREVVKGDCEKLSATN